MKPQHQKFWAVLKAYSWEGIEFENGAKIYLEAGQPSRFIPVFDTREAAVKFEKGDDSNVFECQVK